MVLKFKDINSNWCYMEANRFTVGKIIIKEPPKCEQNLKNDSLISRDFRFKENQIKEEIGLNEESITLLTADKTLSSDVGYVVVVSINDDRKEVFVLDSCREAYLMTDNGKTIERIA